MKKIYLLFLLIIGATSSWAQCNNGSIVISELYFDTHYSEDVGSEYHHFGEYIELFNSSNQPINLNNWVIKDNHTEFKIITNAENPNTVIQPGATKLIIFGGFYNYQYLVQNDLPGEGAPSALGARGKFIELFPQAAGRESDMLVQYRMILYNKVDKVSVYNPNGGLVHEVVYKKGTGRGTDEQMLSYLNVAEFTTSLSYEVNNENGGVFNGPIGLINVLDQGGQPVTDPVTGNPLLFQTDAYSKSIYLSDPENYYFDQEKNIAVTTASPFTIPFTVELRNVSPLLLSPAATEKYHSIESKAFDTKGNTVGQSVTFYDKMAKSRVAVSKDFRTGETWGTETVYNEFGKVFKESFPAILCTDNRPVNLLTNSQDYANLLAKYYSDNNTYEPYQATATHPYSQTNYDKLNPGNLINVTGGNMVNGEWKTSYTYTVPAAQEMYYLYGKDYYNGPISTLGEEVVTKYHKTVTVDANGIEDVVFNDGDGKILATARSGGSTSYPVLSLIGSQGYIDIHIPVGITTSQISLIGSATNYTIYNLKTGLLDTNPLTGGNAYRIVANTPPSQDPKVYIGSIAITHDTSDPQIRGIYYRVNYYDYSLNIYNKTGQLIRTVQPKGTGVNGIITATMSHMSPTAQFVTSYKYNSLDQLTEATTPDQGTTRFLYRKDGEIRYSQNSQQSGKISYSDYDAYGRLIESGVITNSTAWTSIDPDAPLLTGSRSEQTYTIYDYADNLLPGQTAPPALSVVLSAASIPVVGYIQKNLPGNIAVTYNIDSLTPVTWYSYDIYGRVEWIVQYNSEVGAKTIHYYYDHRGNVKKVVYQKDKISEMFVHRYTYDEDVLAKVETSTNDINYTVHTEYDYYISGELKRTEYAGGVQGVDYVYTLDGMLKSINHPSLEQSKDPGNDNNDLFGQTIDYFSGDYLRSGSNVTTSPSVAGNNTDQYNGNIKATRWATKHANMDFPGGTVNQKAYMYAYNRNNWMTKAIFGTVINNNISPTTKFGEQNITFDPNGNILSLQRTDDTGVLYDNLSYSYNTGKNQLRGVADPISDGLRNYDIDGQTGTNYVYNNIGQLTQNVKENLFYYYNSVGLVTDVKKGSNSLIKFFYNEKGQTIKKERYKTTDFSLLVTDYYILDINGNTVAIYTKPAGASPVLKEHPVFDDNRIGTFYKSDGTTAYELEDHLGSIRAVFKRQGSSAVMQGYADYYPFGEQLPTRNSLDGLYRYAFQGQEKDAETGMESFKLRLWDGRIGRWLGPDPNGQYSSPYLGMGNNPIRRVDPDGGFDFDNRYKAVWNEKTQDYDYQYVDNTGGDFYDIIEYSGGEFNGLSQVISNPYIKHTTVGGFLGFGGDDVYFLDPQVKRFGVGDWRYSYQGSGMITPGHFEEFIPVERGLVLLKNVKKFKYAFWSGKGTEKAAKLKGYRTLGQTRAGKNLQNLTRNMLYEVGTPAYKMWGRLSATLAKRAKGEVHVFQNAKHGVNIESIWAKYEYPALLKNKKVTKIIYHNVVD